MIEKDARTILLHAAHGKLCSEDCYKGKPVNSVIEVALDALDEREKEIEHLKFLLRQKKR